VTLLAFAAESNLLLCAVLRRRCSWAPGGCRCRLISPAGIALDSKLAAAAYGGRMTGQTDNIDRQTDRRTPDSFIDPALHTTRAASITDKCVYNSLEISTVISRAHTARVKAIVVEAGARFLSVADGSVCVEEAARAVRGPGKVEAATLGARQAGSPAVGQAASVRRRFTAADTHVPRHVRFRCGNVTKGRLRGGRGEWVWRNAA